MDWNPQIRAMMLIQNKRRLNVDCMNGTFDFKEDGIRVWLYVEYKLTMVEYPPIFRGCCQWESSSSGYWKRTRNVTRN